MYVIVVGCGRVGADLAGRLSREGHDVTVIDYVGSSFEHLDPAYRGRTIEAEPLAEDVLKNAGVENADALAAVTNSDATNAVVAHVARTVFKVPRVVSRNYDPHWRSLHEALGLQTVSTTSWGSQRVQELIESPGLRTVFSAGNGEMNVHELLIGASWARRPAGELWKGLDIIPISLTRGGRARPLSAEDALELGDILHVAATLDGAEALSVRLTKGVSS